MTKPKPRQPHPTERATQCADDVRALVDALNAQIANAKPGEKVVYHTGYLALDADHDVHLQAVRQAVQDAVAAGVVYATQQLVKRNYRDTAFSSFAYMIVKRPPKPSKEETSKWTSEIRSAQDS